MNFHIRDAFILLTIQACEKNEAGASLRDMIGFYDYINHDILIWEDFHESALRLKIAGQITEQLNCFKTSAKYKAWRNSLFDPKKRINVQKETTTTLDYLNKLPDPDKAGSVFISTGQDVFRQALNDYLHTINSR